MNYRGQWVINKRQISILQQCDDKELGSVLKALFKHLVNQESIESALRCDTAATKFAFRLIMQQNGDGSATPSLSPSQKETKEKNQKKGEEKIHSPSRSISIIPQLFDRFWESYPRKVGKAAAEKSFAKCIGKDQEDQQARLEQMLKALDWQKRTEQWQDAAFIPHPSTWLNQRRWEDEPALSPEETAQQAQEDACADINRQMAEFSKKFAS